MADTIRGRVTNVVDGDTFDMRVTHLGKENKRSYDNDERVRIAGIDAPELNTASGKAAKANIEKKLRGKEVRCSVQARDTYGRIVATIKIL